MGVHVSSSTHVYPGARVPVHVAARASVSPSACVCTWANISVCLVYIHAYLDVYMYPSQCVLGGTCVTRCGWLSPLVPTIPGVGGCTYMMHLGVDVYTFRYVCVHLGGYASICFSVGGVWPRVASGETCDTPGKVLGV